MAISVVCRCGKTYRVGDSLAGKRAKCPACGHVFTVPVPQQSAGALLEDLPLDEPAPSQPASKPLSSSSRRPITNTSDTSNTNVLWLAGAGAAGVTIIVGLLLVLLLWPSSPRGAVPVAMIQHGATAEAARDVVEESTASAQRAPSESIAAPAAKPDETPGADVKAERAPVRRIGDKQELNYVDFVQANQEPEKLILCLRNGYAYFYMYPNNRYNDVVYSARQPEARREEETEDEFRNRREREPREYQEAALRNWENAYRKDQQLDLEIVQNQKIRLAYTRDNRTFSLLATSDWKTVGGRELPGYLEGASVVSEDDVQFQLARSLKPDGNPEQTSDWEVAPDLDEQLRQWLENTSASIADVAKAATSETDHAARASEHYQRGTILARDENYAEAIAQFTQSIALRPDFASAYADRGLAYYLNGDLQEAFDDVDEAIRRSATLAAPYRIRAEIYQARGEKEKAAADLQKAKELEAAERKK